MTNRRVDRRDFLRTCAGGAAAASLFPGCSGDRAAESGVQSDNRPNIVLIMADDMGYSDLGCYGSEISTPHIDALANGGIRFTQFYNAARCCPTRASLMTGLYPHQAGVGDMVTDFGIPGYRGDLNRQCVTIAEALKPAGYSTLMSGKWHVTPFNDSKHNWPCERGFDHFFGTIEGAGNFFDPASLARDNEYVESDEGFYYTDAIADNAVRYVEDYGARQQPFFLYLPFTAPHWPLHAPEAAIAKWKGRYDQGWDQLRLDRHRRMKELGVVEDRWPLTPRDPRVPSWEDAEHKGWQARRMEVYAAQVEIMDHGVGRIMSKLRDLNIDQNTLVLFLADNGGCDEELTTDWHGKYIATETRDGAPIQLGNYPSTMPGPENTYQSYGAPWANASNTPFRLYKHWVHEGGIATPLIAHWPQAIQYAGVLTHSPGHIIDVMATCVDVAEAPHPETYGGEDITPLEGKSLRPIFADLRREGHEAIFWEHEGNRAVRQGNWKLVSRRSGQGGGEWELYDLEADRTELANLASQEPAKVAELIQMYDDWARRSKVEPWLSWRK